MAGIRLEWAQFGNFDHFEIYRSQDEMDVEDLPVPLATVEKMYFVDDMVVDGETYHYRIATIRGLEKQLSDEVVVVATPTYDNPTLVDYVQSEFTTSLTQQREIPSSTQEGDIIIAIVMHRSALSMPAGWTKLGEATSTDSPQYQSVYFKEASSDDAGKNVTFTQSSNVRLATMLCIFRHELGCEIINFAQLSNLSQSSGSVELPTISPTRNGVAVVGAGWTYAATSGNSSFTPPATFTPFLPTSKPQSNDQIRQGIAYKDVAINGQITDVISGMTSDSNASTSTSIAFVVTYKLQI